MIESGNHIFSKAVIDMLEEITDEIDKGANGKQFMLQVIINKALTETVGRPVTEEDFIDEKTHLKALGLVKEWVSCKNYANKYLH